MRKKLMFTVVNLWNGEIVDTTKEKVLNQIYVDQIPKQMSSILPLNSIGLDN